MTRNLESNRYRESNNQEYDNFDWERPEYNKEKTNHAREHLRKSFNEETLDQPFRSATKRKLNPKFVGALAAIGFAAVITFDTAFNGPSSFVVEHPEAATTALAGISAAVGALAYKLTRGLEHKEQKSSRSSRTQEQRRNKW